MILPSKSKFAFQSSVEIMPLSRRGNLYLWTFTFTNALEVADARKRWSKFLSDLTIWRKRAGGQFYGLRVFELHPRGHGLHIHVLTSCYWHVTSIRKLWQTARLGGGRVHVRPVPANRAMYAAKYLRKRGRPECFHGVRMWAAFGNCEHCRVKDVRVESNWTRTYHALVLTAGKMFTSLRWHQRQQAVDNVEFGRNWSFGLFGVGVLQP